MICFQNYFCSLRCFHFCFEKSKLRKWPWKIHMNWITWFSVFLFTLRCAFFFPPLFLTILLCPQPCSQHHSTLTPILLQNRANIDSHISMWWESLHMTRVVVCNKASIGAFFSTHGHGSENVKRKPSHMWRLSRFTPMVVDMVYWEMVTWGGRRVHSHTHTPPRSNNLPLPASQQKDKWHLHCLRTSCSQGGVGCPSGKRRTREGESAVCPYPSQAKALARR